MSILTPPKVLREKLGDDGVDALVDLVNKANEKQKEDILLFVGEKFEGKLDSLSGGVDAKLDSIAGRFDAKLDSIAGRFDAKLEIVEEKFERRLAEEIAKVKTELIKWMFIFWVGQIAVLTGLILAFVK